MLKKNSPPGGYSRRLPKIYVLVRKMLMKFWKFDCFIPVDVVCSVTSEVKIEVI